MRRTKMIGAALVGLFLALNGADASEQAERPEGRRMEARPAPEVERLDLPAPVEVAMGRRGPQPAIEVMINGEGPFRFAIDSGGSGLGRLDVSMLDRFDLPVVGTARAGDPTGQNAREVDIVGVETLSIGDATFHGVELIVGDYSRMADRMGGRIDGILGFGLFRDLLFTLDFPNERVRLERGALDAADGETLIAFTSPRGVPVVPVTIAGIETHATLDTGNMVGLMLAQDLVERIEFSEAPRVVGRAATRFNEFEIFGAPLKGAVRFGSHEIRAPDVVWSEMMGDHTNMGLSILDRFALTFDQKNGVLRVVAGSHGGSAGAAEGAEAAIARMIGDWEMQARMFPPGDGEPRPFTGRASWSPLFDGRAAQETFTLEVGGRSLHGRAFLRRAGDRGEMEFAQADAFNPRMFYVAGAWDPETGDIVMERVAPDDVHAPPIRWIYRFFDDGSFVKEMWMPDDQSISGWRLASDYRYTRRSGGAVR